MSLKKYIKNIIKIFFSYLPSEIKIFVYLVLGAKIGKNVEIGFGSIIIPFDFDFKKIEISDNVIIEDNITILSKNLHLEEGSQIKDNTKIWGQSNFRMGKSAYIDQNCLLDLRNDITLGNRAGIGAYSLLYTHGVWHSVLEGAPARFGPIIIHDRAWIPAGVFIMPNITIGEDSMIGSRAVIVKDVEKGSFVAGNPAKEIAKTSQFIKKLSLEDKITIVRDILKNDLLKVYDNNVSIIMEEENSTVFYFWKKVLAYYPNIDKSKIINLLNNHGNKLVIVSFGIPEEVIEFCSEKSITWFDLESSERSRIYDKKFNTLTGFFSNYGIQLKESKCT